MAHVCKYAISATGHMLSHYDRSKDNLSGDIDLKRTKFNYNLAFQHEGGQLGFLHKRLSEVKCLKRKDVNVLCDWVITRPKDLSDSEEESFFKCAFDFLCKRYGQENVISAYVHKDETTPHMHFAFIPVTADGRVSAKRVINRTDLRSFHSDLSESLEMALGHPVHILNGVTKDGNKTVNQLKAEQAAELQRQYETLEKALETARREYEAKTAYIQELSKVLDEVPERPEWAEFSESKLLHRGTFVKIPEERWNELKKALELLPAIKKAQEHFDESFSGKAQEKQIESIKEESSAKIQKVSKSLDIVVKAGADVCKAIGNFAYDENFNRNLSSEQINLVKSIRADFCKNIQNISFLTAQDVRTHYGISRGIQVQAKKIEHQDHNRQQNYSKNNSRDFEPDF